jgi:TonB family protein
LACTKDGQNSVNRLLLPTFSCCMVVFVLLSYFPYAGESNRTCPKGETKVEEGCLRKPRLLHQTDPVYPKEALRKRLKGHVTLEISVMEDGSIGDIEVKESTNPGHGFEEAAIDACKQRVYAPGALNGKPVAMWSTVEIDFTYR